MRMSRAHPTASTLLLTLLTIAVIMSASGCLKRGAPAQPTPPPPSGEKQETQVVGVYFAIWSGNPSLVRVDRQVPKGDAAVSAKGALEALIAGPTADERSRGLTPVLPKSTRVLSTKLEGTTLTVDFSKEIITRASQEVAVSGTGEALALKAIEQTVANFSGITRVKLLIEGKSRGQVDGRIIEDFWGHIGLPEYLTVGKEEPPPAVQSIGRPTDGLAIKSVRWSGGSASFRLVLDIVQVDGTPATVIPYTRATLSAGSKTIHLEVNGIRRLFDQRITGGKVLSLGTPLAARLQMDTDESKGCDQMVRLMLTLNPSRQYTYKLFSLNDPPRIVVDVFPRQD